MSNSSPSPTVFDFTGDEAQQARKAAQSTTPTRRARKLKRSILVLVDRPNDRSPARKKKRGSPPQNDPPNEPMLECVSHHQPAGAPWVREEGCVRRASEVDLELSAEVGGVRGGEGKGRAAEALDPRRGSLRDSHATENAVITSQGQSESSEEVQRLRHLLRNDPANQGGAASQSRHTVAAPGENRPDETNGVCTPLADSQCRKSSQKEPYVVVERSVEPSLTSHQPEDISTHSSPDNAALVTDNKDTAIEVELQVRSESNDPEEDRELRCDMSDNTLANMSEKTQNTPVGRKRVRFLDTPNTTTSVTRRTGLFSIIRQRRQSHRRVDQGVFVHVERDEKGRQVVLDELQYLLDGIFDSKAKRGGARTMNVELVTSSLKALVELLLRKGKKGEEGEDGILLAILGKESQLLETILNSLFQVLGKSGLVDVLVALVLVVVFGSTCQALLVEECNMDFLLTGFFRSSAMCLKEDDSGQRNAAATSANRNREERRLMPRRRGRIRRRFESTPGRDDIANVNDLVIKAEILDEDFKGFKGFKNEAEASVYLMGVSLSLLLQGQETARQWMRKNRRLDRVVAVLYSAEKMLLKKGRTKGESDDEVKLQTSDLEGHVATSIVMNAAMKVLEYATLDPDCRLRVARESRVDCIALNLIRRATKLEGGISTAETMVSSALRMCLNLMYDCKEGSEKLMRMGGVQVIVDCLATEGRNAGLLEGERIEGEQTECFDVRVLCLTVLAGMIYEDRDAREGFSRVHARGIAKRECGSIGLILEMLTKIGAVSKSFELDGFGRREGVGDEDGEALSVPLETRSMVGYFCLVVGILVHNCETNRKLLERLMPQQSMLGMASVVDEFLEFHQEIGATSQAMERMFEKITMGLLESAEKAKMENGVETSNLALEGEDEAKGRRDTEMKEAEREDEEDGETEADGDDHKDNKQSL